MLVSLSKSSSETQHNNNICFHQKQLLLCINVLTLCVFIFSSQHFILFQTTKHTKPWESRRCNIELIRRGLCWSSSSEEDDKLSWVPWEYRCSSTFQTADDWLCSLSVTTSNWWFAQSPRRLPLVCHKTTCSHLYTSDLLVTFGATLMCFDWLEWLIDWWTSDWGLYQADDMSSHQKTLWTFTVWW